MSPTLWLAVAAAVSLACLVWLVLDLRKQALPRVLLFVTYAIFFRFLLSAFHPITFPPLVGPLSLNALFSVMVIGLGFLVIDKRLLCLRYLLPIYGLLILTLVSAVYNDTLKDSIESLLKWMFFLVVVLAVYESILRSDRLLVLSTLLKAFAIPAVLQLVSVGLGYSKATENDGSISYVGGYYHEAVFSVILLTALVLAAVHQINLPRRHRTLGFLPMLLAVEVAFTNYRTTILSMLLPLAGYLYFRFLRKGMPLAKVAATLVISCVLLLLSTVDFGAVIERFAEIGTVLDSTADLIKSPIYYTEWEQDYFSARVYIWSQYIDAYLQGNQVQWLIGLGADSWQHQFRKYAHNTFVSYVYELGALGCLLIAFFFLRNLVRCFAGPLTTHNVLLFLCYLGFLIINLGTLPLWQIEGMILFAVLNALVWELQLTAVARQREDSGPEARAPNASFGGAGLGTLYKT